jgi:hypothetical protein
VTTRQVFGDYGALEIRQGALGESREHVCVRMSRHWPRHIQPLSHDIGEFWHFCF